MFSEIGTGFNIIIIENKPLSELKQDQSISLEV